MSNVDRLVDAGILKVPLIGLTPEQTAAIESLTQQEVEGLISSQAKLYPEIEDEDKIILYPGIPRPPTSKTS